MRLYYGFLQRVAAGTCTIGHVRDVENPADFLTKWLKKDKYEASIKFATNSGAAVPRGYKENG